MARKPVQSFIRWSRQMNLSKPKKRIKKMSNQLIKEVQKSGMLISKEKLIEMIRKSSQTTFSILQSPNSKEKTVVI